MIKKLSTSSKFKSTMKLSKNWCLKCKSKPSTRSSMTSRCNFLRNFLKKPRRMRAYKINCYQSLQKSHSKITQSSRKFMRTGLKSWKNPYCKGSSEKRSMCSRLRCWMEKSSAIRRGRSHIKKRSKLSISKLLSCRSSMLISYWLSRNLERKCRMIIEILSLRNKLQVCRQSKPISCKI